MSTPAGASDAALTLYYWPTTNGLKVSILLEELAIAYQTRLVNIRDGEQHENDFKAISASGRIPAIVDRAPAGGGPALTLFESGAIMIYLAEKAGRLLGQPNDRHTLHQWLFWQAAQVAPTLGKLQMFEEKAPERIDWVIDRFRKEAHRLYATLNQQLQGRSFVVGDVLTIADIGLFPWILPARQGIDPDRYPNVERWRETMKQRPALQRAYAKGRASAPSEKALIIE